jgi:hypothetical protein
VEPEYFSILLNNVEKSSVKGNFQIVCKVELSHLLYSIIQSDELFNSEKPDSSDGEFEQDRTPSQTSCTFNRLKVSRLASILWHFLSNSSFFYTA